MFLTLAATTATYYLTEKTNEKLFKRSSKLSQK